MSEHTKSITILHVGVHVYVHVYVCVCILSILTSPMPQSGFYLAC